MKERISALTILLLSLFVWQSTDWMGSTHTLAQKQTAATNLDEPQLTEKQRQKLENFFQPARKLLLKKGVPFNPDLLLEPDWKEKLKPVFSQMTEFQNVRRVGTKVEGVQIADTLYLPEYVEVTKDVIIIARRLIFEGKNATIKGPHNIYVFPMEVIGSLEMSLESAMQEQGIQISQEGIHNEDLKSFIPRIKKYGINIDAGGRGYKEWLEKRQQKQMSGQSLEDCRGTGLSAECNGDRSPGAQGVQGGYGVPGSTGGPNPATQGANGVCNWLYPDPDGKRGSDGNGGGTGGTGGTGGRGEDGEDGLEIVCVIPTSDGTYTFSTKGGQGGKGGTGGTGGPGGPGATGGRGGNGRDCLCSAGGAGDGGSGGDGGGGGRGGDGGSGGPGATYSGEGGVIRYTKPSNFTGTIMTTNSGGLSALPGDPGSPGSAGPSGAGGQKGTKGTNFNCPESEGAEGQDGGSLTAAGGGNYGSLGTAGNSGQSGPPPIVTTGPCAPPTGGCSGGKGSWDQTNCRCVYANEILSPKSQQQYFDKWYFDLLSLIMEGLVMQETIDLR